MNAHDRGWQVISIGVRNIKIIVKQGPAKKYVIMFYFINVAPYPHHMFPFTAAGTNPSTRARQP